jgi:hypothetical protein
MQLQLQLLIALPSAGFGGSAPPVPTDAIITESSEFFITEDGDDIVQE